MYALSLDIHITFSPPMGEHAVGIVLTRKVELPFPPLEGLRLYSRSFDDCPEPEGFTLKDVVWDMDRSVFVAKTSLGCEAYPIREIVGVIRDWVARGWALGSYRDDYQQELDDDSDWKEPTPEEEAEQDRLDSMHMQPPNKRPKEFNTVMKALVRHMAETFDQLDVAYAMDKTGMFFWERKSWDTRPDDPREVKFVDAKGAFDRFSQDEQMAWRESVMKYRSLEELVKGTPRKRDRKPRRKARP